MERNIAQEEAIKTVNGQVLLISCPGSGKTTTMIRRIQSMLEIGIDAKNIVMVTFTEAAASEMKDRFQKQYGDSNVTFCTIHSLCLKILMNSINLPLRIMSTEEQYGVLYDSLRAFHIPSGVGMKDILSDISAYKNGQKKLDEFKPTFLQQEDFLKIYQCYEEQKKLSEFMDFDDLLCLCKDVLTNNVSIRQKCRSQYRYIMCDEYQDTNYIQKEILYLLTGKNGNLCVVGDDDQSIYGFRGANPHIMMDFKNDYPNVHEIHMDTNYRSQPEIIEVARNLIENNTERFQKDIKAARTGSGKVVFHTLNSREDELQYLVDEIKRMQSSGTALSDIAVLARTNIQLDDIAATFERCNMKYTATDSIKGIYEHFIFRDLISYLRLINGIGDHTDLIQILNKPNRYLRETDFRMMDEITEDSIMSVIRNAGNYHKISTDAAFKLFSDLQNLKGASFLKQLNGIVEQIGYRKYLVEYAKKTNQNDDFLFSKLRFFMDDARKYHSIDSWKAAAAYHTQNHKEQMKRQAETNVTLSTMHRSKGLEWDTVFLVDCCHGTIPISKADSKESIEEERRLFYVAITRAKETLYVLTYNQKQTAKEKTTNVKPSPFLAEMKNSLRLKRMRESALKKEREKKINQMVTDFEEGDVRTFRPGMEVHHQTYGTGIVISKTLFFVNIRFNDGNKTFPLR